MAVVQMLAQLPTSGIAQLVKRVQRMLTRAGTDGQMDVVRDATCTERAEPG